MIKKEKTIISVLAVLCIISIISMVLSLTIPKTKGEFVPPEFDKNAVVGVPDVPQGLGWSKMSREGMSFTFSVCGNVIVNKDNEADVYFTNPEANKVWLKLRITDTEGNILGETGLIKPGEYIQTVMFDEAPKDNDKIKMKIMSYEPRTYYSEGSVILNTSIRTGG